MEKLKIWLLEPEKDTEQTNKNWLHLRYERLLRLREIAMQQRNFDKIFQANYLLKLTTYKLNQQYDVLPILR